MPYRLLCHEPRPGWLVVSNSMAERDSCEAEVVESPTGASEKPGQNKAPSVQRKGRIYKDCIEPDYVRLIFLPFRYGVQIDIIARASAFRTLLTSTPLIPMLRLHQLSPEASSRKVPNKLCFLMKVLRKDIDGAT